MAEKAPSAVKEAYRALKNGKRVLSTNIFIKDKTPGYEKTRNVIFKKSPGLMPALENAIEENCKKLFVDVFKEKCQFKIIGEGFGEHNKTDLMPIKGEWYSVSVIDCEK